MNVHISQRLAGVGLFVAVVVVMGCRGNDHVEKGATTAVPSETPATVSVTRTPAATVIPTVPSSAATTEGCPIDDSAMCEFAAQLQDALNANRIAFITQRLMPEERPCRDLFTYYPGEDVGCANPEARSVPIVPLLRFGGDCCSTRVENFEPRLIQWINEQANAQPWRLYAVMPNAHFWKGGAILLVRGNGDGAPTIVVGTSRRQDTISVPGVVVGLRGQLFVLPDEEFLPWP